MADYYTLLTRESGYHPWSVHAGSYERSEMIYEQTEGRPRDLPKSDTLLIKTGDTQTEIEIELRLLNRARLVELSRKVGIKFEAATWEMVQLMSGQLT